MVVNDYYQTKEPYVQYITLIITMVETTGKEPYGRVDWPRGSAPVRTSSQWGS